MTRFLFSCLCVLLLFASSHAQRSVFFDDLRSNENEIADTTLMRLILEVPYDAMVNHLEESSIWLNRALGIAAVRADKPAMAKSYSLLAITEYLRGNYDLSVSHNLNSIQIFESIGLEKEHGDVLCQLGYQMKRRDLPRAFSYFRKGIKLLEENNATVALCAAYDNYGVLFEFDKDLDSAQLFYNKALQLKNNFGDSIGIPYSLNNLGLIAMMKEDYDQAKKYFDQAYAIRVARNDLFGITENLSYYGDLFLSWKKYDEAIVWFEKSNELSDSLNYPRIRQDNLLKMAGAFESLGRYDLALFATRHADSIGHKLINEQNSKTMLELEQKFQVAQKDADIAKLQSQTATRRVFIILSLAALVVVVFAAIIYNVNLRRKKAAEKNRAVLHERESGLKAVFDATEDERRRIARDLHDGIGQQLSGLRLSLGGMENKLATTQPQTASRLHDLNAILDEACREVRSISHQMMPKALSERGLLSALEETLTKSIGPSGITYRLEHFQVENRRFENRVELSVYRIAQELLNNILRHSGASDVVVQLYCNANKLILVVEDNGRGFDPKQNVEGIGLLNIKSRLQVVNGSMIWEKNPSGDQGMVVTIRIPL
jgi:signal transduction histidine kinase